MSRLSPVDPGRFAEDERRAYDQVSAVPQNPRGPTAIWLRSPLLAKAAVDFGDFIRFNSTLRADLRELAVLVTARACNAQNAWYAHRSLAEREGLPTDVIEAVAERRRPWLADADAAIVYDVAAALTETQDIDDQAWARAVERLGERTMIELISTVGFYTMIAMLLNGTRADLPEGAEPPLPA